MTKTKFLALMFAGILFAVLPASGEEASRKPDYHAITAKFLGLFAQGKVTEAVDDLFGRNPYMSRKADEIAQLKSQVMNMASMMGEYDSHELIVEKSMGKRFVNLTYLAYYNRQPIRLNFQFYKAKDGWVPYTFTFDDNFAAELREAAKAEVILPACAKQK